MLRHRYVVLAAAVLLSCTGPAAPPGEPLPPLYEEAGPFLAAMRQAGGEPSAEKISGITVPHHLLAADLIAGAWARVAARNYNRIIILSPDHYSRSRTPFAVSRRNFDTVLGPLSIDEAGITQVLQNPLVSGSNLFSHEHGVQALLPFAAYHFPRARIIALAISLSAKQADWDSLAETLAPLLTPETLLVQSTDFSHYLPAAAARGRDQETLRVLSGGDPEAILGLKEPEHLDSKGAQYLQLRLQRQVFRAGPTVTANRNSQEYTAEPLTKTTSYIVQLYSAEKLAPAGIQRYFFAGDTFFGRAVATKLSRKEFQENLIAEVLKITGGARLILNLEGVIMPGAVREAGRYDLWMDAALSLPLLQRLKVWAVIVANNHSRDFGRAAYRNMVRLLEGKGIIVLKNGDVRDMQHFRLAAFTDVDNRSPRKAAQLRSTDLDCLDRVRPDKPRFAFLHWGQEYTREPGPREEALMEVLQAKGVELIMGCHTHRAGTFRCRRPICLAFSLGNFIFDQSQPGRSGALLEVGFFPQGTYFLKWHAMENLFVGAAGQEPSEER